MDVKMRLSTNLRMGNGAALLIAHPAKG